MLNPGILCLNDFFELLCLRVDHFLYLGYERTLGDLFGSIMAHRGYDWSYCEVVRNWIWNSERRFIYLRSKASKPFFHTVHNLSCLFKNLIIILSHILVFNNGASLVYLSMSNTLFTLRLFMFLLLFTWGKRVTAIDYIGGIWLYWCCFALQFWVFLNNQIPKAFTYFLLNFTLRLLILSLFEIEAIGAWV